MTAVTIRHTFAASIFVLQQTNGRQPLRLRTGTARCERPLEGGGVKAEASSMNPPPHGWKSLFSRASKRWAPTCAKRMPGAPLKGASFPAPLPKSHQLLPPPPMPAHNGTREPPQGTPFNQLHGISTRFLVALVESMSKRTKDRRKEGTRPGDSGAELRYRAPQPLKSMGHSRDARQGCIVLRVCPHSYTFQAYQTSAQLEDCL